MVERKKYVDRKIHRYSRSNYDGRGIGPI